MRQLAYPNRGHSNFPHHLWSSYEYLIHHQSEILVLNKWSYRVAQIIMAIELRMVIMY